MENISGINLLHRGKVRDVYDLNDKLLIVATDRISAFDYILQSQITSKGKYLTELSIFWFNFLKDICKTHFITSNLQDYPLSLQKHEELLGRSMIVKKAKRIDLECIVRGYITGSGLKEYNKTGSVCGIKLPQGLKESSKLKEPIFTPSTKAEVGDHDENINEEKAIKIVGKEIFEHVKQKSK